MWLLGRVKTKRRGLKRNDSNTLNTRSMKTMNEYIVTGDAAADCNDEVVKVNEENVSRTKSC